MPVARQIVRDASQSSHTAGAVLARYGVALAAVAICFSLREVFNPALGTDSRHLFFVPAIVVASAFGGFGPGFAATISSVAIVGYFYAVNIPDAAEIVSSIAFGLIGVGIAWTGEQLRRERTHTKQGTQEMAAREAHLKSILDTVLVATVAVVVYLNAFPPTFHGWGEAVVQE